MVRISAGKFRGRSLQAPNSARPSTSKVRQALLNSLQLVLLDANVLDLFAGSGALGFEALSRGAKKVYFVEQNKKAFDCLRANAKALLLSSEEFFVIKSSVIRIKNTIQQYAPFDVIFADPPYFDGWEKKLLDCFSWSQLLTEEGSLHLEAHYKTFKAAKLDFPRNGLELVREKAYGDTLLLSFKLQG